MRAMALLSTLSEPEMLAQDFSAEQILFRLFHEDGVRIWDAQELTGECACPPRKFHDLLARLPRAEVEDCKVDDVVSVTCEFCGKTEIFDDAALDALYQA